MSKKESGGIFIPNAEYFERLRLRKDLDAPLEEVIKEMIEMFPMCNEIRNYKNQIVWKRDDSNAD